MSLSSSESEQEEEADHLEEDSSVVNERQYPVRDRWPPQWLEDYVV